MVLPSQTAGPITPQSRFKETTGGFAFASKRIGQLTAKRLPEEAEGGQRDVIFLLREPLSTGALRTEIQTRKLILEEFSVLILKYSQIQIWPHRGEPTSPRQHESAV